MTQRKEISDTHNGLAGKRGDSRRKSFIRPPPPPEPPMIERLCVKGLLSFRDEVCLDFDRLNLLVGSNGSGKSNLLDCLRLFQNAPADIANTFEGSFGDWLWRGEPASGLSSEAGEVSLNTSLSEYGPVRHHLRLRAEDSIALRCRIEEEIVKPNAGAEADAVYFSGSDGAAAQIQVVRRAGRGTKRETVERSDHDTTRSVLDQVRDTQAYPELTALGTFYRGVRIYSEWQFGRGAALRGAARTGRAADTVSEKLDDLYLFLSGVEGTATHERIAAKLREVKETYADFHTSVRIDRIILELEETLPGGTARVPAGRLSDGTLRFISLAAVLLHDAPPPLICLEEPELGMHPDMLAVVAGMIVDAKKRTQLIVNHPLRATPQQFGGRFRRSVRVQLGTDRHKRRAV